MAGIESLIIAPQWIGDAVMTEPLLRCLAARGERLTVGALPWVAPVYRAMPQVAQVIEFPFQHGGLQLRARRQIARELSGRFDCAYDPDFHAWRVSKNAYLCKSMHIYAISFG